MKSNEKKLINISIIYSILACGCGVFYREFTKVNNFTGDTSLSVLHTHYFVLGMLFFLVLALFEKNYNIFTNKFKKCVVLYQVGLNMTVLLLVIRGVTQVLVLPLSKGMNAAISGTAGIGHIILGVSIILMLFMIKKTVYQNEESK